QRSTRSGRAFLLVLVYLKGKAGAGARIDTTLAAPLFGRLWRCFRESDFIGWYREGRVAGAVLTELRKDAGAGVARLAAWRLRSGDRLRQEPESDGPGAESPSRRARERQFG